MKYFYFWMLALFCSSLAFSQLSEDFESDITANGWSFYSTEADDPGFVQTTIRVNSGSSSYYHDDSNTNVVSTSYMVSPQYTVQSGDALAVYVNQNYSNSYYEYSGIAISTSSSDPIANPSDFVEIWEAGEGFAEDQWTRISVDLAEYVGQDVYFAFVYSGDYNHEFYVDDLFVGEACEVPVAETTVVPACESGQFNVLVNLTDFGTATSVEINDNAGNTSIATTAGNYTFGPYTSGSAVTIYVADAENTSCGISFEETFYCPPPNDDCSGAQSVTSFPFNETGDATGATQEALLSCGNDAMNDGLWFSFEGESAQFTINLTSTGWDSAIGVFSGSCDALSCVDIEDSYISGVEESYSFIGQAGVTYYVNIGHRSTTSDQPEGVYDLEILSEEIPCNGPSNLASSAVTDLSADISWQANAENASYDLVWGPAGFTPGATANATGITGTTYTIAQLSPETSYDVYIRGNCEPGLSEWIGPLNFTTLEAGAILPGTDCVHPINITSLPYTTQDDTANYGDDYEGAQGSNCGNGGQYYLTGDDVVYAYTPAEDTSIDISMLPGATYSSIFVYASCNDIGVECIAGVSAYHTEERLIENLVVEGGQTYYIVISTWTSPQSTTYTLEITENTCIDAQYTLSAVGQCETNEFMVDIEFTDMGSLDSYEVTDNQGGAAQTITAPGTYSFGPYESLTTVDFTFAASDPNCDAEESIYYACPPLNDECVDATEVPVNEELECVETVTGSISGATDSGADACYGTADDDVWFSFTATETVHLISLLNLTNGTSDLYHAVYSGSCGELVDLVCSDPNDSTVEGLTPGETYYVQVYSWTSTPGQTTSFDICIKTLPEAAANDDCAGAVELTVGTEFGTNPVTGNNIGATSLPNMPAPGCAGYQGGEVWFTAVAPESGHIIFETNPVDGGGITDTGMAVYTGTCDGLVLVECDDNDSASGLFSMIELENQTPGTVYYIAVWEYGNNQMGEFQVSAYDNYTCIPPQLSHESTLDCEAETFSVTLDITDLGSSEEITVTNSADGSSTVVTAPGTWTFGPYEFGTTANINVDTGNEQCNDSFSYGYTACPPTNDDCSVAAPLTVGTNFESNAVTGNNTSATSSSTMPAPGCAGYQGGEVWYTAVAPESGHIIFETNPADGSTITDTGMAVYTGTCDGLVLVDCDDDSSDSGLFSMIELENQTPGTVYYIAVWEYYNNAFGDFQVSVYDDQTCTAPVYTTETTLDCDAGTYNIVLNFTDLGSAAAITLSDAQGASQTADAAGTYTFGPYEEGTEVVITADTGDVNCNFTLSFTEYCPAANDECDAAIEVPVNDDFSCDQVVSASNIGATASAQADDAVGTPSDDVWFSFVATSTDHRISLSNVVNQGGATTSTDMAFAVYDASNGCEALAFVDDSDPNTLNITGLTAGNTYLIRVYTWGSAVTYVSFDLCIGTPPSSTYDLECGTPLEMTYCYDNNEIINWTFNSPTDEPVTISFSAGSVEDAFDFIRIYDGPDATSPLLFDSQNANPSGTRFDLTGSTFTATSGTMFFSFTSDSSVSCPSSTTVNEWEFTVNCGTDLPSIDWANLQFPENGSISAGQEFMVYGQVYEEGVTEAEGQGEGILAWVGYSTEDTDPETWTNWIPATFNAQVGNNDEYMANLGGAINAAGTYYYATRYQLNGGFYYYGGYNGGAWDGVTNVSGVLTVEGPENDDCMDALELTVGSDFGTHPVVASNAGASAYENMPAPGCAGYQGGEVWFTVTVPSSGEVTIESNPVDGSGITDTGLAVYSGSCDALTLIECDDDDSGSGLFSMVNLTGLTPGDVLYVAVWEYGNNTFGSFQVSAYGENVVEPCVAPEYTTSTIVDCEAGTYSVMYEFTSLGSSTSVVLTDDQGNSTSVDAVGSVTVGTYAEGTEITVNVITDDTGSSECDSSDTFYEECSYVDNDECVTATELVVGANFDEASVTGTTIGATSSSIADPSCGDYQGGDVWFMVTVPSSGQITVETQSDNGVTSTGMAAYAGSCDGTLTEMLCDAGGFAILSADGLNAGDVYYIRVWSNDGSEGTFSIAAYTNDMAVSDINGIANVKVYPNPTSEVLNISGVDVKDVTVFSASGQMAKVKVSGNVVDTRNLPTGTYVIRIVDMEGNVIQKKFIKK